MGKQYDWELEKYRLGKKSVDKGNKRRMIKNFFRFVKNPIGYISWKTIRWFSPMPKFVTICGILYWGALLWYWKGISEDYQEIDDVLQNYGKNVEGTSGRMKAYHNRKEFHRINTVEAILRSHFQPNMVTLNPTWRQNIRKELQLTNKYNVAF